MYRRNLSPQRIEGSEEKHERLLLWYSQPEVLKNLPGVAENIVDYEILVDRRLKQLFPELGLYDGAHRPDIILARKSGDKIVEVIIGEVKSGDISRTLEWYVEQMVRRKKALERAGMKNVRTFGIFPDAVVVGASENPEVHPPVFDGRQVYDLIWLEQLAKASSFD